MFGIRKSQICMLRGFLEVLLVLLEKACRENDAEGGLPRVPL